MPGMSDYLEPLLLKWLLRNTQMPTPPATVYIALHTADPTDAGTTGEVATGSYARVAVTTGTSGSGAGSGWGAPGSSGTINSTNGSAVTFPAPTANWGTITNFSVWDASSGGNCLATGQLTTSRAINNGDGAPRFDASTLTLEAT